MLKVQRANVMLDIEDDELSKYMNLGYNLIDDRGNILQEAIPTDIVILQSEYVKHKAEIKSLKEEIDLLKAKSNEEKEVVRKKKDK